MTTEQILARTERRADGCLLWLGAKAKGYGRIAERGRVRQAHVLIWERLRGPVPEGMDVDHQCHNSDPSCPGGDGCYHRACIEITHLRPKTRSGNVRGGKRRSGRCKNGHPNRGNRMASGRCRRCHNEQTIAQRKAKRTRCPQGHPYDEENTLVNANGRRMCRICLVERAELMRDRAKREGKK